MSMTIGFTCVTPEESSRAERDRSFAEGLVSSDGRPWVDLGKSWGVLQYLFDAAEVGIDFLEDGHRPDGSQWVFAWPVELVRRTAETLSRTPFERLAEHFDQARMNADHVYGLYADRSDQYREEYRELVDFFTAAAESGRAMIMDFG